MPADVYSQRMQELNGEKEERVQQMFPNLSRPSPLKRGNVQDLNGNLQPPQQEPVTFDQESMFHRSLEQYKGQDSRFEQLTNDYTALVSGLKQQVDAGMMPEVIAKQKLQQFLTDGRGYFMKNKPKPRDNPQIMAAIDGMMQGAMEAQGDLPPEGGAMMPQGQPPMPQGQPAMPQGGM